MNLKDMPMEMPRITAEDVPLIEFWFGYLAAGELGLKDEQEKLGQYLRKRVNRLVSMIDGRKTP